MSIQQQGYGHQEQLLYQARPDHPQTLKSNRDHIHNLCNQHRNQHVRVETLDGETFEGMIMHCDRGILYLRLQATSGQRALSPFSSVILPLVLYELLVITLLYL
ncbi:hypothetical protein [Paenibacillus dakarensis]|uniref:hypothetical protein n=1 Tax=Paenibacillus dakarensis TaxID=1527293 RepID=UPI0006D5A185|nr:hypothetical protein [Paenibacillus dakarensis]